MTQTEIQNVNPLFEDVQLNRVFPDGKTFVDCLPKYLPEEINSKYIQQKNHPGFSLEKFVLANFDLPAPPSKGYSSDLNKTIEENIEALWNVLTREPDKKAGSLIPLPYPFIVPGGRFGEIYYWDSYFTMLGLQVSGRIDSIENMVNNFSHLIDEFGYIPNGNRTYYIGRSQPPFYSLMVKLLSKEKGEKILLKYLPQLEKEYRFWMKGVELLNHQYKFVSHVVLMADGETLNRYWDENDTARPESYREDVELAIHSGQEHKIVYRHLRAGAESGWDFSSRWFKDGTSLATIHTTDIVPVDLNCLLLHLEQIIAEAHQLNGNIEPAKQYRSRVEKRKAAIQKYCWDNERQFYIDYDASAGKATTHLTLAAGFPLFFKMADEQQASGVASMIREKFLCPGGVVTTLVATGQQWDAPNGWAPLHWMTIVGLENYGHHQLAKEIAHRWIRLNVNVFKRTGKLMEKYNVVDTQLEAGGGEYPGQDGFGWTNGVLLELIKKYEIPAH